MIMPNSQIALVDDHVLLRSGLASLISSFDGFDVVLEADHGKDFISQVEHKPKPDIVLLDISMPEMNGYETADWIREHLPLTKVIVLSMMESDLAIIRMLRCGARGYILKDSKPEKFRQALSIVRDEGFYTNELVSSSMWHYMGKESRSDRREHPGLTEKEMQFLKLASTEKTYKQIADEMCVSPRTVDSYRDALFEKLHIQSRVGLVLYAVRQGIIKV